jgi:hypothetical protein
MGLERRLELLDWANKNDVWVIEDDYNSEFRHQDSMIASLRSLDREGRAIYLGTFSKIMMPNLRLGTSWPTGISSTDFPGAARGSTCTPRASDSCSGGIHAARALAAASARDAAGLCRAAKGADRCNRSADAKRSDRVLRRHRTAFGRAVHRCNAPADERSRGRRGPEAGRHPRAAAVTELSWNSRRARAWCSATGACAWRTRRHCSRESQLASAAAPAAHHPIRRCPRPCSRNKERLSRRRCIAHRAPGSSKGPVERLQISQTMRGCQVAERRPI